MRAQDHAEALQLRLDLAQSLAAAEKKWKDRLIQLFESGSVLLTRSVVCI